MSNFILGLKLRVEYIDIQLLKGEKYYTVSCSVIFTNLFSFVLFADNWLRERITDTGTHTERRWRAFQQDDQKQRYKGLLKTEFKNGTNNALVRK
jgi:hypothetical protein